MLGVQLRSFNHSQIKFKQNSQSKKSDEKVNYQLIDEQLAAVGEQFKQYWSNEQVGFEKKQAALDEEHKIKEYELKKAALENEHRVKEYELKNRDLNAEHKRKKWEIDDNYRYNVNKIISEGLNRED